MFGLLNKKKEKIVSPATGEVMPLSDVSDPVFADKIMGDGYAVRPEEGKVFAPISGTVEMIFPTKHAISIKTQRGLETLVHMGFDTVELEGAPFEIQVTQGQKVEAGQLLAEMNLNKVIESGLDTTIAVVYTNMNLLSAFPEVSSTSISAKDYIGDLIYK